VHVSVGTTTGGPTGSGSGKRPIGVARPGIRLTTEIHEMVDAAILALDRDPELYQRDGELVRIVRADVADPKRGIVAGTPQIRRVEYPTMLETLSRCIEFFALVQREDGSFGPSARKPPKDVAAAVLARGQWPGIRPLSLVTETPSLRPDGSVLDRPGYDASTAIVYLPDQEYPAIPKAPTQPDAMRALLSLLELFADFPFASEPARYVPIAAILTMLGRPAIVGAVPAMLFDASTRGSGKSLIEHVVAVVTTGRSASIATYPVQEEELEKILAAAALFGSRLLTLDNITSSFGCGPLDKCITADDRVQIRILGKTEQRELAWRALVLGSGNNVVLGADTARRCLVSRLEPMTDRPEDRTGFKHPDLLGFVRSHRGALVRDGLTILRAFALAGRPNATSFTWGSFNAWAQLIPAAIAFAGGPNVLAARAVTAGVEEPEVDALRALLAGLPRLSELPMTAKTIVTSLYTHERVRGKDLPPDGHDELRTAIEFFANPKPGQAPDPKRLGNGMRKHRGRIVGRRRLVSKPGHGGVSVWSVETLTDMIAGGSGGSGGSVPSAALTQISLSPPVETDQPDQPDQPMQEDWI
jgi:hypothetical protein